MQEKKIKYGKRKGQRANLGIPLSFQGALDEVVGGSPTFCH
jgi:hypothetical protein